LATTADSPETAIAARTTGTAVNPTRRHTCPRRCGSPADDSDMSVAPPTRTAASQRRPRNTRGPRSKPAGSELKSRRPTHWPPALFAVSSAVDGSASGFRRLPVRSGAVRGSRCLSGSGGVTSAGLGTEGHHEGAPAIQYR
jgi:hypothetical protein